MGPPFSSLLRRACSQLDPSPKPLRVSPYGKTNSEELNIPANSKQAPATKEGGIFISGWTHLPYFKPLSTIFLKSGVALFTSAFGPVIFTKMFPESDSMIAPSSAYSGMGVCAPPGIPL